MVSPSMDCQLALTMTSIIIGPSLAIYISQVRNPGHDSLEILPIWSRDGDDFPVPACNARRHFK
jgi:hypothetical protein